MEKEYAVLELGNKSYKLMVGYMLDDKVDVLYCGTFKLSVPLKEGDVFDMGSLINDLSKLKKVQDKEHSLTLNISEVVLIYPPIGIEVYEASRATNTISNVSKVDKIDIVNALSLIKKSKIPKENNSLVDIIPTAFYIDGDKSYRLPPLGEISQTLGIKANVYTLPGKMMEEFKKAVTSAGIKVVKEVIAPVGVSYFLASQNFKYVNYMLIDFGAKTTSVSLVNESNLIASTFFSLGSDDLTEKIAKEMETSYAEAEKLKEIYGIDTRASSYNPTLVEKDEEGDFKKTFTREDLTAISSSFMKTRIEFLTNAIKTLLDSEEGFIKKVPLVFIGGGSLLNGMKDYILKFYPTNICEIVKTSVIGAEDPSWLNCLGGISYCSIYKSSLTDTDKTRVSELKRESEGYVETDDQL
jgi:cell division protein FtsA